MTEVEKEVRAVEAAFARTMAERDLLGFLAFVHADAVFVGDHGTLRGAAAVESVWRAYFEGPEAPFAWEPETVEMLAGGDLAASSGPVYGAGGRRIGSFHSVWRRGADGAWRVIFDRGGPEGRED